MADAGAAAAPGVPELLPGIPEVELDEEAGTCKYVQIQITLPGSEAPLLAIRHAPLEYHDDIFQAARATMRATGSLPEGTSVKCIGGGRLAFDGQSKSIRVYGYSMAYGRPDHSKAVAALYRRYPEAQGWSISWSNEGY